MEKYFYHGIECYPGTLGKSIEKIINILDVGLKNRNEVRNYNDEKYNHVCLYQKNDEIDYNNEEDYFKSARANWIDSKFVIIISPDIKASKVENGHKTGFISDIPISDLKDEWRSEGDITSDKIVGVALPLNYINNYISQNNPIDKDDINILKEALPKLKEIIEERCLMLLNSEKENFTDELDDSLKIKNKLQ